MLRYYAPVKNLCCAGLLGSSWYHCKWSFSGTWSRQPSDFVIWQLQFSLEPISSPGLCPLLKLWGGHRNPWTWLSKHSKLSSILSYDAWWNGVFGSYFQHILVMFILWQSESVVQTKPRHFIMLYGTKYSSIFVVFWNPCPGLSPPAIWNTDRVLGRRLVWNPWTPNVSKLLSVLNWHPKSF